MMPINLLINTGKLMITIVFDLIMFVKKVGLLLSYPWNKALLHDFVIIF